MLLAALLLLFMAPTRASAQTADETLDEARAEAAFREAKRLMQAGQLEEACAKFEESQNAAPGSGTLLNLADCQERVGRVATAWATFRAAASLARAKGNRARAEEALARSKALEPRLPKLRVVVPPHASADGLLLFRNGVVLGGAEWGRPFPTDPGTLILRAEAPNRIPWSKTIVIPREAKVTEVLVPRLLLEPGAPAPATTTRRLPDVVEDRTVPQVVGVALAGTGLAAYIVGAVFGVKALQTQADTEAEGCTPDNFCTDEGLILRDEALMSAHVSTTMFAVGTAMLVAGAIVFFVAPGQDASTELSVGVQPVVRGGALFVEGAF